MYGNNGDNNLKISYLLKAKCIVDSLLDHDDVLIDRANNVYISVFQFENSSLQLNLTSATSAVKRARYRDYGKRSNNIKTESVVHYEFSTITGRVSVHVGLGSL